MRDDELRRYLRSRNPWWKSAASGQVAGDPNAVFFYSFVQARARVW